MLADTERVPSRRVDALAGGRRRRPDLVARRGDARLHHSATRSPQLLGCGFVAARKPASSRWTTPSGQDDLEYGFDALELHADAIRTGRACSSATTCSHRGTLGGECASSSSGSAARSPACVFVIELEFLHGRETLGATTCLAHPLLTDRRGCAARRPCRHNGRRMYDALTSASRSLAPPAARRASGCRPFGGSNGSRRRAPGRVPRRVRVRLRRASIRPRQPRRARLGAARARRRHVRQPHDLAAGARSPPSSATSPPAGSRRGSGRGPSSATRRSGPGP